MIICPLCNPEVEQLVWHDANCRVIHIGEHEGQRFSGYCRVVWQKHVAEMSDLTEADQRHLMAVVIAVEKSLRELLAPDKINLASLGNVVPHLHWHVIPRWRDDSYFPQPIWATPSPDKIWPATRPEFDLSDFRTLLTSELGNGEMQ